MTDQPNFAQPSPSDNLAPSQATGFQPSPLVMGAGGLILSLVVGIVAYNLGVQNGKTSLPINPSPALAVMSPSPTILPSPSPLASLSPVATPSATTQATLSQYPTGWLEHTFSQVNIKLGAPSNWKSDFQAFTDSSLIRFWQGKDASTATIQLDIKKNWDNTGNAQYLDRTFVIEPGLMAAKVEPPKMDEQKLDRYQTNYYFEKNGSVYVLTCVHNWISSQIQICETMLKTGSYP